MLIIPVDLKIECLKMYPWGRERGWEARVEEWLK
jgi:hypothetical protein